MSCIGLFLHCCALLRCITSLTECFCWAEAFLSHLPPGWWVLTLASLSARTARLPLVLRDRLLWSESSASLKFHFFHLAKALWEGGAGEGAVGGQERPGRVPWAEAQEQLAGAAATWLSSHPALGGHSRSSWGGWGLATPLTLDTPKVLGSGQTVGRVGWPKVEPEGTLGSSRPVQASPCVGGVGQEVRSGPLGGE